MVSGQLTQLLSETLGQHSQSWTEYVLRDPVLFGDYRNALEADAPRLYEDVQDYDAAKALFQEVGETFAFIRPIISIPVPRSIHHSFVFSLVHSFNIRLGEQIWCKVAASPLVLCAQNS